MYVDRFDETWHRLREWTSGQAQAEALAAQVISSQGEGFERIDPAHPHGGPDGGMDAIMLRDGSEFVMAAYFPRGQKSFNEIKVKFKHDLAGVKKNNANGIAFVSNQELRLRERQSLKQLASPYLVEIYHLERMAMILDRPEMSGIREQFLNIPQVSGSEIVSEIRENALRVTRRLEAVQTGGDTFCYGMLYDFDINEDIARNFAIAKVGEFNLYDLRFRLTVFPEQRDILKRQIGELNSPAVYEIVKFPLRDHLKLRFFFNARNGAWTQDLQLRKSVGKSYWPAAVRVLGSNGRDVRLNRVDSDYVAEFGSPEWDF